MLKKESHTSWKNVGKWYHQIVGEEGHHYHQTVIIPHVKRILNFSEKHSSRLLDLGCGQGILSRHIPSTVTYTGIDVAAPLLEAAKKMNRHSLDQFIQGDVTTDLSVEANSFSHATLILALQNIEKPFSVFKNAYRALIAGGQFIIVINHPCFRIPRQSSWKIDDQNKIQFRRIDRYMSAMKIPIQAHPSQGKVSMETWSFHHPLSDYTKWLKEAGFMIENIEEWCSNKTSEGSAAKMENRSRSEIPLFMGIVARKV